MNKKLKHYYWILLMFDMLFFHKKKEYNITVHTQAYIYIYIYIQMIDKKYK